jgi:hypothetical protein
VVLDHEEDPGNLSNAICLVHAAASAGTHTLLRAPWRRGWETVTAYVFCEKNTMFTSKITDFKGFHLCCMLVYKRIMFFVFK